MQYYVKMGSVKLQENLSILSKTLLNDLFIPVMRKKASLVKKKKKK